MSWQVEEIRLEGQLGLLSQGKFKVLLYREIQIVDARITNIRVISRRIAERLVDVEWPSGSQQTGSWAGSRKIKCLVVEPKIRASLGTRNRSWVPDQHRTVRKHVSAIAISICVVDDSKWRTCADSVDCA